MSRAAEPGGVGILRLCVKVRMTMCGVERERSLVAAEVRSSHRLSEAQGGFTSRAH